MTRDEEEFERLEREKAEREARPPRNGNIEFERLRREERERTTNRREPPLQLSTAGDDLHDLLLTKGFDTHTGCACDSLIRQMNANPIEWSYRNLWRIVDSMAEEGKKRRIKVFNVSPPEKLMRLQAARWVKQSLRNTRKKQGISTKTQNSSNLPPS